MKLLKGMEDLRSGGITKYFREKKEKRHRTDIIIGFI